ncbi:unnamed protein product (plasmid) [Mycetohabitans rhizoxinica HKI 454]|uniref:Uncharacterized protein n=1 Tax=Mycetohabitans rhizoxinica (strain DSM 19002 / CIP 109453 / HKI 454) TaxID=882378 RepID=E5AV77_MYCRK|nr:unnamed protein product [Mycetohabitans rhizoxinica HKI 454]
MTRRYPPGVLHVDGGIDVDTTHTFGPHRVAIG